MRKVTVTKEGYLISYREIDTFTGEIMANIRLNLRSLKRIGRISQKEHKELETFFDRVLYPIKEKYGVKE